MSETETYAAALLRILETMENAHSAGQAAGDVLDAARDGFGWVYGSLWIVDRAESVLRFKSESGSVGKEFRQVTAAACFREGVGLNGYAWRRRNLVFVENVGCMSDCCRAEAARRARIQSGVCFPIIIDDEVIGTMDFLAIETLVPSLELLGAMYDAGRLVSCALDRFRKRVTASLTDSVMEVVPSNVIYVDKEFRIRHMNRSSSWRLKLLERFLPMTVEGLIGQPLEVLRKRTKHQQEMLSDPGNLPRRIQLQLGSEILDLLVSPLVDLGGERLGSALREGRITNPPGVECGDAHRAGLPCTLSKMSEKPRGT